VSPLKDLIDEYEQTMRKYGITRGALVQSPGYAEGYGVGVARRLAGKRPTLDVLAEHGVTLDEFRQRVNAHGGDFATAVDAVLAEIETAA
jgi:hypothetical protein